MSNPSLPTTQQALVAAGQGLYHHEKSHAMPAITADRLIVRISHVALNPCNWKMVDFSPALGSVGGNDFSGVVVHVGTAIQGSFKNGDRVCGFLYGLDPSPGSEGWAGSFAEYISVPPDLVLRVPEYMTLEEATCLGAGVTTAGMALFQKQYLGLPTIGLAGEQDASQTGEYVLVYGGSTATGTMAIQLLKLAGMKPITTCSPANNLLVEGFGAVKAFDYHGVSCGPSIRAFTRGKLRYAVDCIADTQSTKICYTALGPKGGRYVALEPPAQRVTEMRRDVVQNWVMALTIFGKVVELGGPFHRDATPSDRLWADSWYRTAEKLVADGLLKPHPREVRDGSIESLTAGVDDLRAGTVKGKKLVYRISSKE